MQIIIAALAAMGAKLLTASFLEYVLLFCARILVKKTSTNYDDEFLAKIEEILGKSSKEGK